MLEKIRLKVFSGERLTRKDAIALFEAEDIFTLGALASHVAENKHGENVYFVRNRHINPTNICVNRCRFCAFSRSKGEEGAYELTIEEIIEKLQSPRPTPLASRLTPYREVHIVGGLHPDWPFEHYLRMLSIIKKNFPGIQIKAFTAIEVEHMSRISGLSLDETILSLKRHGLNAMPGGGAEIFDHAIRSRLCPEKISGERWLEVMETAHRLGIISNATMLYGHIESYEHRVDHLLTLRALQDRTGGFKAFVPLSYHPEGSEIGGSYSSGIDDLKTIAVSRLVLDNFDHITAYWIMLGEKISQLALLFGADDLSGTVMEEKITHSAGALTSESITPEKLSHLIQMAGKAPVERDTFYRKVTGEKL